jgi:hypothetical protein
VLIVKIDGTGKFVAAGILNESQGAKPGEKIFFGRDATGKIVSKMIMLNDGSVTFDTNTETTGEATGDYNRKIKGLTTIIEKKDRNYTNEKNVNESIDGDYTIKVKGNLLMNVTGTVKINGSRINLN